MTATLTHGAHMDRLDLLTHILDYADGHHMAFILDETGEPWEELWDEILADPRAWHDNDHHHFGRRDHGHDYA